MKYKRVFAASRVSSLLVHVVLIFLLLLLLCKIFFFLFLSTPYSFLVSFFFFVFVAKLCGVHIIILIFHFFSVISFILFLFCFGNPPPLFFRSDKRNDNLFFSSLYMELFLTPRNRHE